jgi:type VI secretion system secreted protein Hcp
MAQPVYLWLEIEGTPIKGEVGRGAPVPAGSIECFSFHYGLNHPVGPLIIGSSLAGSPVQNRVHEPVRFHKRINKSTPHLLAALCERSPVTKAEFRFFRPDPTGLRGDQHYFTVELEEGFVCQVQQISEEATMAARKDAQAIEEVSLIFHRIKWRDEIDGSEHIDEVL